MIIIVLNSYEIIEPGVLPVCIAGRLNSYELVEPPDGQYGAPEDNGTWNGMVGMLMRGVRQPVLFDQHHVTSDNYVVQFSSR